MSHESGIEAWSKGRRAAELDSEVKQLKDRIAQLEAKLQAVRDFAVELTAPYNPLDLRRAGEELHRRTYLNTTADVKYAASRILAILDQKEPRT